MAEPKTYMLTAQDEEEQITESTRLEFQYAFLKYAFGNRLLHPQIGDLGPSSKVADVGTGTGVWLNDLARTCNSSGTENLEDEARFVGFDIAEEKFPKRNERGVRLVVHDCLKRFPEQWRGIFDVVHLRLLVYAIREVDVVTVVKNVVELLREIYPPIICFASNYCNFCAARLNFITHRSRRIPSMARH